MRLSHAPRTTAAGTSTPIRIATASSQGRCHIDASILAARTAGIDLAQVAGALFRFVHGAWALGILSALAGL